MGIDYQPLWDFLEKHNLRRYNMQRKAGIGSATLQNMLRGERVSLAVIERVCEYLHKETGKTVRIENVLRYTPDSTL